MQRFDYVWDDFLTVRVGALSSAFFKASCVSKKVEINPSGVKP